DDHFLALINKEMKKIFIPKDFFVQLSTDKKLTTLPKKYLKKYIYQPSTGTLSFSGKMTNEEKTLLKKIFTSDTDKRMLNQVMQESLDDFEEDIWKKLLLFVKSIKFTNYLSSKRPLGEIRYHLSTDFFKEFARSRNIDDFTGVAYDFDKWDKINFKFYFHKKRINLLTTNIAIADKALEKFYDENKVIHEKIIKKHAESLFPNAKEFTSLDYDLFSKIIYTDEVGNEHILNELGDTRNIRQIVISFFEKADKFFQLYEFSDIKGINPDKAIKIFEHLRRNKFISWEQALNLELIRNSNAADLDLPPELKTYETVILKRLKYLADNDNTKLREILRNEGVDPKHIRDINIEFLGEGDNKVVYKVTCTLGKNTKVFTTAINRRPFKLKPNGDINIKANNTYEEFEQMLRFGVPKKLGIHMDSPLPQGFYFTTFDEDGSHYGVFAKAYVYGRYEFDDMFQLLENDPQKEEKLKKLHFQLGQYLGRLHKRTNYFPYEIKLRNFIVRSKRDSNEHIIELCDIHPFVYDNEDIFEGFSNYIEHFGVAYDDEFFDGLVANSIDLAELLLYEAERDSGWTANHIKERLCYFLEKNYGGKKPKTRKTKV
ncbi:MAG: hypothetical protein PHV30_09265, partial [Candidatus Margulisbacteria bacterium]|nr:hypothetical protein [Candidatus Margulisiibacteriota bacterium]